MHAFQQTPPWILDSMRFLKGFIQHRSSIRELHRGHEEGNDETVGWIPHTTNLLMVVENFADLILRSQPKHKVTQK